MFYSYMLCKDANFGKYLSLFVHFNSSSGSFSSNVSMSKIIDIFLLVISYVRMLAHQNKQSTNQQIYKFPQVTYNKYCDKCKM